LTRSLGSITTIVAWYDGEMVCREVVLCATIVVAFVVTAGCLDGGVVTCGDLVCPQGLAGVPGGDTCAPPDQIAACAGSAEGDPCTVDGATGMCAGGVCVLPSCDGISLDPGEACDGAAAEVPSCVDEGFDFGPSACSAACTTVTADCGSLRPVLARAVTTGEVVLGSPTRPMLWRGPAALAYVSAAPGGLATLWARGTGDWISYTLPATLYPPVLAAVTGAPDRFYVAAGADVIGWDGAAFTALPPVPSGGYIAALAAAEDVVVPLHVFAQGPMGWDVWRRDPSDPEGWVLVGYIIDMTDMPPTADAATFLGNIYWPIQTELYEVSAGGVALAALGLTAGVSDVAAAPGRMFITSDILWLLDGAGLRGFDTSAELVARPCGEGVDAVNLLTGQRFRHGGDGWAPLPVYGPSACNDDGGLVVAGNEGTEVRTYEGGIWAAIDDPPVGAATDLVIMPGGDVYAASLDRFAGRAGTTWKSLQASVGGSLRDLALGADLRLYGVGGRGVSRWTENVEQWDTAWPGTGVGYDRVWPLEDGLVVLSGPGEVLVSPYAITFDPIDPGISSFVPFLSLPDASTLRDTAGTTAEPVIAVRELAGGQYRIAIYERVGNAWVGPIREASGSDGRVLDFAGARFAALPDGALVRWQAGGSAAATVDVLPLVPRAIAGTGADDVLVVGYATDGYSVAFHFDGSRWSPVRVPTIDGELQAVAIAEDRIVLAGSTLYWLERIIAGW
jgi:hypothetical protein